MEKQVVEINGVKLELDLREAKRIDTLKIGTKVKVLRKKYSGYESLHGIVVGFDPFKSLPTIIVAALAVDYSEAKIEMFYVNSGAKETELVASIDDDFTDATKERALDLLDGKINKLKAEIEAAEGTRDFFLKNFAAYWNPSPVSNGGDTAAS